MPTPRTLSGCLAIGNVILHDDEVNGIGIDCCWLYLAESEVPGEE